MKLLKLLISTFVLFGAAACTKSCNNTSNAHKAEIKKISTFPAINVKNLSKKQLDDFIKITNDEICPCDCPKSFAACLAEDTKCEPAKILGQWLADRLTEGAPSSVLEERMSMEIASGFLSNPKDIKTEGYNAKGSDKPDITIVEFADFECAHCKIAAEALQQLVQKYPNIKVVFKHFPLSGHPYAKYAALATQAAGNQGKFWEMHNAIYLTQDKLTEDLINVHAQEIIGSKNLSKYKADIKSDKVIKAIENSLQEAHDLKLQGTPSIFFNGRAYHLSYDLSGLELRLKMEMARDKAGCN